MEENQLTGRVIGAAIEVHRLLGPGLLESTHQHCLAWELDLRGLSFERERPISLDYKGTRVPHAYRMDFLIEGSLVVELKAVDAVTHVHRAQLLTYLKWSELRLGLLINFNVARLKQGVHRLINGR